MMDEKTHKTERELLKTPQEEFDFLRKELEESERRLDPNSGKKEKEEKVIEKIKEYRDRPASEVLDEGSRMSEEDKLLQVSGFEGDEHGVKLKELLGVMEEKGVHNTLSMVIKMKDPHLEDDLHRVLVQCLKEGYPIKGLKEKTELWRSLKMTLFEISLPERSKEDDNRTFREIVASMEQFYAGMHSIAGKNKKERGFFTFEIATSENNSDIVLYTAVPTEKIGIFEKQVLSVFPDVQIIERKNDYNIFVDDGVVAGSIATLKKTPALPIKGYDEFEYDPLKFIFNSFSKIAEREEGVALQFVFNPGSEEGRDKHRRILDQLEKGVSLKEAVESVSWDAHTLMKGFFKEVFKKDKKKDEIQKSQEKQIDNVSIEAVKNKVSANTMPVNIRIIASSRSETRAVSILDEIESSFNQFESSSGNKIEFKRLKGKKLQQLSDNYIFRRFVQKNSLPLNTKEITSMMHLHRIGVSPSPEFKQSSDKTATPPSGMNKEGVLLGVNEYRNEKTEVYLSKEDRVRHLYTVGQTGTGKTNFLKNMVIQDIRNGEGVCMIDPHGADLDDILKMIPKERFDDLIYFEPGYTKRAMALNMLEYDPNFPEQKTFVVNELFSIFRKLYSSTPEAMGPAFEQYFRNATLLVLEDRPSGTTLLDVSRVLSNADYREMKLSKSKNPVVNQFWREIATKAGGESQLENIVPYITNKFDVFAANDIMRPIIAQEKSSFNFKDIMDNRKILLVNLAKGKLGDINSSLIGLILVGKILMSALSREVSKDLPPFYLYIDEFQNVTTDSISVILSEARKYKLSLNVAHQFIAQLDEGIRDSIFGNVGSMVSFRVGYEDAEFLSSQFEPEFSTKNIMNLKNYHAIGKILVNGYPSKPFNFNPLPPEEGNESQIDDLKQLSYLRYGRPRDEIEQEIKMKY